MIRFVIVLLALAACAPSPKGPTLSRAREIFFENSLRRSPLADEPAASAIARVTLAGGGTCTGFYVANDANLPLLMTARHCFSYKATDWCAAGGSVADHATSTARTCKRVVAADLTFDWVLFEVTGGAAPATLTLADFEAPVGTDLRMYGYPVDPYASSGLNVTENCWVRETAAPNPYLEFGTTADRNFLHNCSTYGGNSGGPMIVEGTTIAVAMPNTYFPGDYGNKSSWQHRGAEGIWSKAFVENQRAALVAAGVRLANSIGTQTTAASGVVFRSGTYEGQSCLAEWKATVQAIYNTNHYLTEVKTWWERGAEKIQINYSCSGTTCTDTANETSLAVVSPTQVRYLNSTQSTDCVLDRSANGRY